MKVRNTFTLSASRTYVLIVLSALCYFILAYYTQRHQTTNLFVLFSLLFGAYLLILRSELSVNQLVFSGYFFRLIFIVSLPILSDDFYRFIWDGRLTLEGVNPFSILPSQLINNPAVAIKGLDHKLFEHLDSPDFYSVYPPVCQFIFWLAAMIGGSNILVSVIAIRIFILAAEYGTIHFLRKLFKIYGFEEKYTAIYFLNPLVIIELAGNLHFEALMIFFVIVAVYAMKKENYLLSGALFGLAISTKLLPLMLLPFFIKRIGINHSLKLYLTAVIVTVATFLPLLNSNFIAGFTQSLGMYFHKFEFNASIYYIVREVGLLIKGVDIINIAGLILAIVAFISIIILAFKEQKEKNLLLAIFIWPLLIYYSLSAFVKPWYITPILAFSLFSRFRFTLVWSYFIFLTYVGYSENIFNENLLIVVLEYLVLFGVVVYELIQKRGKTNVY